MDRAIDDTRIEFDRDFGRTNLQLAFPDRTRGHLATSLSPAPRLRPATATQSGQENSSGVVRVT
jgi:hypothetical protein